MSRSRRLDAIETRVARLKVPQAIVDEFGPYADDPVGFCRNVLGVESATRRSTGEEYQYAVLQDVAEYPSVAAVTGHGTGKTATISWALLWWALCRGGKGLVLAPEFSRQIKSIVFTELKRWVKRSKTPLPVSVRASRLLVGDVEAVIGMSTAGDVGRLEGFHDANGVLVVADEVKAIPQTAIDAIQGAMTSEAENRMLLASVPGGQLGPLYKAATSPRWHVHRIPSTDSSLVSPKWVEGRKADWGERSPMYQTRVKGEFASAGEGVLLPLHLLEAAVEREVAVPTEQPAPAPVVTVGLDVSRSVAGDQNCAAIRRGDVLERLELWREPDLMQTVQKALGIVAETGAKKILADEGGVGAGLVDRLRQLQKPVVGVNFGGASKDPARWLNLRAQLYWEFRERLEAGTVVLRVEDTEALLADLSAVGYSFDARGRIVIQPKDEIREKLGHSPDRADAVVLAFASAQVARVVVACSPGGDTCENPWAMGGTSALAPDRAALDDRGAASWWGYNGYEPPLGPLGR